MWIPGEALVAPGPRVTKTTPGRPVALPTASAIIAGAAFLAANRYGKVAVMEGIQYGEIALTRYAKHVAARRARAIDPPELRRRCAYCPWRASHSFLLISPPCYRDGIRRVLAPAEGSIAQVP